MPESSIRCPSITVSTRADNSAVSPRRASADRRVIPRLPVPREARPSDAGPRRVRRSRADRPDHPDQAPSSPSTAAGASPCARTTATSSRASSSIEPASRLAELARRAAPPPAHDRVSLGRTGSAICIATRVLSSGRSNLRRKKHEGLRYTLQEVDSTCWACRYPPRSQGITR